MAGRQEYVALYAGSKKTGQVGVLKIEYDKAIALADELDVSFSLSEAKSEAANILRGIHARGVPTQETLIGVDGKAIVDNLGNPVKFTKEQMVQLRQLNEKLEKQLSKMLTIDDIVAEFEGIGSFEQMKQLRTDLFDLKNATIDGKSTNDNRLAGRMYDLLTDAMNNPTANAGAGLGDNAGRVAVDDFQRQWRRASLKNAHFEKVLDLMDMKKLSTIDNVGNLVRDFFQPGKSGSLRLLRRTMPKATWERFRNGVATYLTSDMGDLSRKLAQWSTDSSGLSTVFTAQEIGTMHAAANQWERVLNPSVRKALTKTTREHDRAGKILDSKDAGQITDFVQANGGKEGRVGTAVRQEMWVRIINTLTERVAAGELIEPSATKSVVEGLRKSGLIDAVFTESEKLFLENLEVVSSMLSAVSDTGASIRAASVTSNAAEFLSPAILIHPVDVLGKSVTGIFGLLRNRFMGHLLTSKKFRALILSTDQFDPAGSNLIQGIRIIASMGAIMLDRAGDEQPMLFPFTTPPRAGKQEIFEGQIRRGETTSLEQLPLEAAP